MEIKKFWNLTRPSDGSELTDELIISTEKKLDLLLPKLLLELLKIKNGGRTKGFAFKMLQKTCWSDNHIPFYHLFGIINNPKNKKTNILDSKYLTEEWELPEKQIVLTGDGHWWITLDYRVSDIPKVLWIETDNKKEIILAENFDDFFNKLVLMETIE